MQHMRLVTANFEKARWKKRKLWFYGQLAFSHPFMGMLYCLSYCEESKNFLCRIVAYAIMTQ